MSEMTQLQQAIQAAFPQTELRMEEPLAQHTSFRIGGPCEVMAFPRSVEELSRLLRWAHGRQLQPAILGSGTNVLAADAGRRGLVICTRGCLDGLEQVDGVHIRVLAGVSMARAAVFAANLGLSGLEFAHGIPGSVGGGLYMNAGAYGGNPPGGSPDGVPGPGGDPPYAGRGGAGLRLPQKRLYRHLPGHCGRDLCPHAWRAGGDPPADAGAHGPPQGLPALGPSLRRLHLQAACGRLCRRPH
ncbi:MAG: FAD-binding protein [Oscillospiraceae bacterium]